MRHASASLCSLSANLGSYTTLPCLSYDPYPPDLLCSGTAGPPNEPVVKPLCALFPGSQPMCFHSSPQLPPPLEPKVLISAVDFARPHVYLTYASFCDVAPVRKSAAASGACGHTPSQPLFVSASACQSFPRELMFLLYSSLSVSQVILGSTVTRSPNATMAPSALTDLDLAVDFFERGAQLSPRARQALVRLPPFLLSSPGARPIRRIMTCVSTADSEEPQGARPQCVQRVSKPPPDTVPGHPAPDWPGRPIPG